MLSDRVRAQVAFRDPQSLLGRLEILFAHPFTVMRAYALKLLSR
jgi:hypothetical protein